MSFISSGSGVANGVKEVIAGDGIVILGSTEYPIINATVVPGGGVQSINAGLGTTVTGDPQNPTITNVGVVGLKSDSSINIQTLSTFTELIVNPIVVNSANTASDWTYQDTGVSGGNSSWYVQPGLDQIQLSSAPSNPSFLTFLIDYFQFNTNPVSIQVSGQTISGLITGGTQTYLIYFINVAESIDGYYNFGFNSDAPFPRDWVNGSSTRFSSFINIPPVVSSGLLNRLQLTNVVPTGTTNVVYTSLGPVPNAWVPDETPPVASPDNHWRFSKTTGNSKINWYPPTPGITKAQLQSFYAVIRPLSNISTAGYMNFSIYTSPAISPNAYATRWVYSNNTGITLFAGFTYLIYALDATHTTTTSGIGVGFPATQTTFLRDPFNVHTDVPHIPFNTLVQPNNPNGNTATGYENRSLLSLALSTASATTNLGFDVLEIGVQTNAYTLSYA